MHVAPYNYVKLHLMQELWPGMQNGSSAYKFTGNCSPIAVLVQVVWVGEYIFAYPVACITESACFASRSPLKLLDMYILLSRCLTYEFVGSKSIIAGTQQQVL